MLIRFMSDLHIEFGYYRVEDLPEDKDTVLVLAGDIGIFKHKLFPSYIRENAERFSKVVMIPGNHEYWKYTLVNGVQKFKAKIADVENVHYLHNESVVIDDILFLGSTLWTSFRNHNPISMLDAEAVMNDYKKIRQGGSRGYGKIRAEDIFQENLKSRSFIFNTLREESSKHRKTVVVTHHGPSYQSIPECHIGSNVNDAYADNLDGYIVELQPDIWIHGHTHESMDYMIENTRVLCNPKGYPTSFCGRGGPDYENIEFNPTLRFEV